MITLYDLTTQVQDDLNERFAYVKDSTLKAYHQIDIISIEKPLRIHRKNSFRILLNPKVVEANDALSKSAQKWLPLYRVEQVRTNCNYIVRKKGTNYT